LSIIGLLVSLGAARSFLLLAVGACSSSRPLRATPALDRRISSAAKRRAYGHGQYHPVVYTPTTTKQRPSRSRSFNSLASQSVIVRIDGHDHGELGVASAGRQPALRGGQTPALNSDIGVNGLRPAFSIDVPE